MISLLLCACSIHVFPVDSGVVDYMSSLTDMIGGALIRFGAVVFMSPVFGMPGALLVFIGVWMGQMWMKAQLAVKRERSNARSPILGHIGAAITGIGMSDRLRRG